jgi:hypothetical protein
MGGSAMVAGCRETRDICITSPCAIDEKSPRDAGVESSQNRRHPTLGHVWQGRFKRPVIQDDVHLLVVMTHIEAKPARARIGA